MNHSRWAVSAHQHQSKRVWVLLAQDVIEVGMLKNLSHKRGNSLDETSDEEEFLQVKELSDEIDDTCSDYSIDAKINALVTVLIWCVADLSNGDVQKSKDIMSGACEGLMLGVSHMVELRNQNGSKH